MEIEARSLRRGVGSALPQNALLPSGILQASTISCSLHPAGVDVEGVACGGEESLTYTRRAVPCPPRRLDILEP